MQGGAYATVHDVQKTQQYVLHSVTLHKGTVCIGDTVKLLVDEVFFYAYVDSGVLTDASFSVNTVSRDAQLP